MVFIRLLRLIVHVLLGMAICAFLFPCGSAARRVDHIRRWSRQLLGICGIAVVLHQQQSAQTPARALIVANHISWLDIFVLNAIQPCRFVAKSDIRSWPCIGWLCAKTGTIFIVRDKLSDVGRILQGLVRSLACGERVAFFPEGTTAEQGKLLPFHANLFEAAIAAKVPVQPYALRYVDGQGKYHPAADFIGATTMVASVLSILKARAMTVEVTQLALVATAGTQRRALARTVRQAIAESLSHVPEDASCVAALVGNPPGAESGPVV